ncbi:M1 family metallopeptidase [Echinimonas agarilytica]|uniref:M1 family metallopeptidase n=1 Tax=Echinimonas agarilytica TaxID=1215918 RepID=A0AA42B5S7_9GAMM|nr:M1 family metallopeptidase [Echinimonas agarilytica]
MKKYLLYILCVLLAPLSILSHAESWPKHPPEDKFRQLEELLPTPNTYRIGSGAPGHEYWQQQADYHIQVKLDDEQQRIQAQELITYTNNSPDTLDYVWVQLDQNRFKPNSDYNLAMPGVTGYANKPFDSGDHMDLKDFRGRVARQQFEGGYVIEHVKDGNGHALTYIINKTMMRIDLPTPLGTGDQTQVSIAWSHNIVEAKKHGGRGGYEYFERDDNYLYEIAQWFPRMAVYDDVNGWQNKQFLGRGEFALEFGDYRVEIDVPADHIVASTGTLQNPDDVLSKAQQDRLQQAHGAKTPVMIVTEAEALANEREKSSARKTWVFEAENVRDFAWASSRKFLWDAMIVKSGDNDVLAMSYYPEEGVPIWPMYSTQSIVHTIEQYNKYAFEYPYPVAISVNGPVGGMEYPMITFNGPRPEIDEQDRTKRTYSERNKYGLISVIIHEIGHIYFPMIVNSDERQWTWMDEGLNTYLQFLAEQAWEENYPSRRGEPRKIVDYMASPNQVPIMTNSESILQFGNNAYGKPATALNILRETIMGRELFDYAFREYGKRWKFKRPMPADFFRTIEDASAVDLDWFWRGWFYSVDHVDISIDSVRVMSPDSLIPAIEQPFAREQKNAEPESMTVVRNKGMERRVDQYPELKDFYNENDAFTVTHTDVNEYNAMKAEFEDWEAEIRETGGYFYVLDFSNLGGLVMPIILQLDYADESSEIVHIPAEIWRANPKSTSKLLWRDKKLVQVTVDPHWQTADVDLSNNHYPRRIIPSRLELFKSEPKPNLMKESQAELEPVEEPKTKVKQ